VSITIDQWTLAEECIGNLRRVLLYGPPGTGKTFSAMHANRDADVPVYSNTLTEETPASELRGHFIMADGSYTWMHGPAIRSWLDGARYVLNELDRASGDCHSFCYAVLDDLASAQLTLPTGITVKPSDTTTFVVTMNGTEADLPEALVDRMDATIKITRPHPSAIAALPDDLQVIASEATAASDPNVRTSIRKWFALAEARQKMDTVHACVAVFGDRAQDIINAYELREKLAA
jgi:MoxR-like ATPase